MTPLKTIREAVKRTARALKRIDSPAAAVAAARPVLKTADPGGRHTMERRRCNRRGPRGRRRSDEPAPIGETPRVLLIAPDQDARPLYACLLAAAGCAEYAVADILEALDVARAWLPEMVVMEWAVPGADGAEIFRQWRDDPRVSTIPIVVVTSLLHVVLSEVDEFSRTAPGERVLVRHLKRSLPMLRDLAKRVPPDERAQEGVRSLINRLQVSILPR